MPPDAPELHEEVDLDLETRRYVLDLHANADRLSHYDLLGIERDADRKTIKRAYFKLAATLHPDRYFGKKLGSFKAKMEVLFKRISDAHETLSAADKRAQYDARLGPTTRGAARTSAPLPPGEAQAAAKRQAEAEAKRQAEAEEQARKAAEGKARAKQHADAAVRAKTAGDFVAAATAYRAALTLAPDDPELKAAYAQASRAAADKLVESQERQALLEERYGRWAAAAASWKRVAMARPNDPKVRERLANALARAAGRSSG